MTKEYTKGIFKIEEDEAVEDHTNTAPYRIGYMVEDRFRTMPIFLEKEELITIRDLINQVLVKEYEK